MNLKGSHLLYLIGILFIIYKYYTTDGFCQSCINDITRHLFFYSLLYIGISIIGGIIHINTKYKYKDPRLYGDNAEWFKTLIQDNSDEYITDIMKNIKAPTYKNYFLYSGNIFIIIHTIPILVMKIPLLLLEYLDKHLSLKA